MLDAIRNYNDMATTIKKLYRSREDKVFAGLFGGIGKFYAIDPVILRLLFVFLGIATGVIPFLVAYVIGAAIVPLEPEMPAPKANGKAKTKTSTEETL
jgi:phage shock protein PspC (stress-responsive transcriptional regulator)